MLGSERGELVGGEDVKPRGRGGWGGHKWAGRVTDSEETAAGLCDHCVCTGRSEVTAR